MGAYLYCAGGCPLLDDGRYFPRPLASGGGATQRRCSLRISASAWALLSRGAPQLPTLGRSLAHLPAGAGGRGGLPFGGIAFARSSFDGWRRRPLLAPGVHRRPARPLMLLWRLAEGSGATPKSKSKITRTRGKRTGKTETRSKPGRAEAKNGKANFGRRNR